MLSVAPSHHGVSNNPFRPELERTPERENVMNAINWFEIPATDFARATRFYEEVLATPLQIDGSMGTKLAILPYTEGEGVGGAVIEMPQAKPHADGTRIYLNGGDDLDVILKRVPAAGGQIVMPKTFLREDIGHIGMFSDSEGNVIGLHSLN
jgi:predicted enzyme related to lactoylglutathione lyase